MRVCNLHAWDVTPAEAISIQKRLAASVSLEDVPAAASLVAGVDVAFDKAGRRAFAAAVVFRLDDLVEIERRSVTAPLAFPYVPGLLTFREGPAVIAALEAVESEPDVIIFDGQGRAHPRRMGLATHMGLLVERPTIGCAKSVLIGEFDEPGTEAGNASRMVHKGDFVGVALRTRTNVRPVYVSQGHMISLERAVRIVLACCDGLRIPKPTREAHRAVSAWKARQVQTP